jgi:tetraacyldisaccharide 4'-kinase
LGESWQQFGQRVISGDAHGPTAALVRAGLSIASPLYSLIMRARNARFDRGMGVRRLPRRVVSVGNITTGGTGKTPVVRWLCERLRDAGQRPGILLRGYKANPGERGDEEAMLDAFLNSPGATARVPIVADPNRYRAGVRLLAANADVDLLVLDDGFQHRRLARDFELVLIDATNAFGFGHVLPRGLLREPLSGLRRADAFLITRTDQVDDARLTEIERVLGQYNPAAPRYRCAHVHRALRAANGASHALDALAARRFFAVAAVGNPEGLDRQLRSLPGAYTGRRWFADHHAFTPGDLAAIDRDARAAGADVILTTEKDWVKLAPHHPGMNDALPIWRLDLDLQFGGDDDDRLFAQIRARLQSIPS